MSYSSYENSEDLGNPLELYKFSSTSFNSNYYYNNGEEDFIYLADTYTPENIKRSQPEIAQERSAQTITVQVPMDIGIADKYLGYLPPTTVWLTIYRVHRTDGEVATFWTGKVTSVSRQQHELVFSCQPIDTAFEKVGLRRFYGAGCNHMLYDPNSCRVDKDLFKATGTITSFSGLTINSSIFSSQPNGWWTAGFMQRSNGEMRFITDHSGSTVTILYPFSNLQISETVDIYAGCDRKYPTCINKFNNKDNYGGFPFVPTDDPFKSGLL